MPDIYISGYDGGDAAKAALRYTRALAGATGAEVIAAAVHEQVPRVFGKGASDRPAAELEQAAHEAAKSTLAAAGVPDVVHVAVPAASPAEGLHHLAEQEGAALVVVGATHRGALGRLLPGSVGERLVHGAPCPVLVVPERQDARTPGVIAVAFDDREPAGAALEAATELAERTGSRLRIVAVAEPLMPAYVGPGVMYTTAELDAERRAELEHRVGATAAELSSRVPTRAVVLDGPVIAELMRAARDADLLVMGSRAYGPARSVLAGSVSRHMLDHAPCPVMVVPRPARQDARGPAFLAETASA